MASWVNRSFLRRVGVIGPLVAAQVVPLLVRADEPSFFATRVAPILDQHCVTCHGAEKHKGELRLDTFEALMRGGASGPAVAAGDLAGSELYRRITLPTSDEDAMPSDGKPRLLPAEIKVLELWIQQGASATEPVSKFAAAPAVPRSTVARPVVPMAPDWRPYAAQLATLQRELGIALVPRSQISTDGLVLRTASAPQRCDDAVLGRLHPIAPLIVEAELARSRITDAGLATLATWENLRTVDLTRTGVTSVGVPALRGLKHLEVVNLTLTQVDDVGVAALREIPTLKQLWLFGSRASAPATDASVATATP